MWEAHPLLHLFNRMKVHPSKCEGGELYEKTNLICSRTSLSGLHFVSKCGTSNRAEDGYEAGSIF